MKLCSCWRLYYEKNFGHWNRGNKDDSWYTLFVWLCGCDFFSVMRLLFCFAWLPAEAMQNKIILGRTILGHTHIWMGDANSHEGGSRCCQASSTYSPFHPHRRDTDITELCPSLLTWHCLCPCVSFSVCQAASCYSSPHPFAKHCIDLACVTMTPSHPIPLPLCWTLALVWWGSVSSCSEDLYVFQLAFCVRLLQQGISALAQYTLSLPSPMLSHTPSLSCPSPSFPDKAVCVFVCACVPRMDGDAVYVSWELQGDWGNGEGYCALTTVTMQCPLSERLRCFTSLHLSLLPLLSLSPYRLRWTDCPLCSNSSSAATTSPGKSLYLLTPSSPQDSDRGCICCGWTVSVHSLGSGQGLANKLQTESTQICTAPRPRNRFIVVVIFCNFAKNRMNVFGSNWNAVPQAVVYQYFKVSRTTQKHTMLSV